MSALQMILLQHSSISQHLSGTGTTTPPGQWDGVAAQVALLQTEVVHSYQRA